MDIEKIEIVLNALKLGSFTKAALIYNYTPSALTHMADLLEREIGTKFIRRTNKGIEIENDYVVSELKKICDIKNKICSLDNKETILTIGTYSSISKYILPKILKRFTKKYTNVKFEIYVDDKKNVLADKGVDIIFTESSDMQGYKWTEIVNDSYFAVFPSDFNPLQIFSFDDKYDLPFILPNETAILNRVKLDNYSQVIKINAHDDSSVIEMVKTGSGMSVLPYLSLMNYTDVKKIPVTPDFSRTLGLFYKENNTNIDIIKDFEKNLKEYVGESK